MRKLFEETAKNIREIRDLVENNVLDVEIYPLDSFVSNQGFVCDLLSELNDCIEATTEDC